MVFSLAIGASGWPDMSKVGPPAAVLFYYVSAATDGQIRVLVRADLSPAQQRFLQERGSGRIQAEELAHPMSHTLPIPDDFIELDEALASAQRGGFGRDCAGVNPHYGCGRVVHAELHTSASTGRPIWTFAFGQDARGRTIARQVDAVTGRVVVVAEAPPAVPGGSGGVSPFSLLSIRVQLSKEDNAPAVAAVPNGRDFWVVITARAVARARDPVACSVIVLRSSGRELANDCQRAPASDVPADSTLRFVFGVQVRLGVSAGREMLDVNGTITANGLSRALHTAVEIYR
jgi:hypothetical protein